MHLFYSLKYQNNVRVLAGFEEHHTAVDARKKLCISPKFNSSPLKKWWLEVGRQAFPIGGLCKFSGANC